jgi:uncharacterized protein (TIGR02145 family)
MRLFTRQGWGRTLLLAAVMVVGVVCVSYGDNPPSLVGQWVSMNNGRNLVLFKDGTGFIQDDCDDDGNCKITWKTEGKRFMWSYVWPSGNSKPTVSNYTLSGYELTMIATQTSDDDTVVVWVRKDKVEEYKSKKNKEAEQRVEKLSSYFTDSRDGQKYRTVKIGGKTWMAQNLNYQTDKSWCYGDNNSNCEKYGRLYDWNTADTACPIGWHLPSQQEWNDLVAAAGAGKAGKALKSTYGWDENSNGTDEYGFSALPGGWRSTADFGGVGELGTWWTATKRGSGFIYCQISHGDATRESSGKGIGVSIRCLQDVRQ